MLMYNSSSGDRPSAPSPQSSPSSHRLHAPAPAMKKPERPKKLPTWTLEGYTGVMDHKVIIPLLHTVLQSVPLCIFTENNDVATGSSFEIFFNAHDI